MASVELIRNRPLETMRDPPSSRGSRSSPISSTYQPSYFTLYPGNWSHRNNCSFYAKVAGFVVLCVAILALHAFIALWVIPKFVNSPSGKPEIKWSAEHDPCLRQNATNEADCAPTNNEPLPVTDSFGDTSKFSAVSDDLGPPVQMDYLIDGDSVEDKDVIPEHDEFKDDGVLPSFVDIKEVTPETVEVKKTTQKPEEVVKLEEVVKPAPSVNPKFANVQATQAASKPKIVEVPVVKEVEVTSAPVQVETTVQAKEVKSTVQIKEDKTTTAPVKPLIRVAEPQEIVYNLPQDR